ncbi:MAG TPA: hypothetical protein VGJ95_12085 [Pseudonocardiaceae bacterium]
MSDDEIGNVRAAPTWPARVAAAHTVARELRALAAQSIDPELAAMISVPVLLLVGADSPDEIKADPEVVAGQPHIAHLTDPKSFADEVLAFLRD